MTALNKDTIKEKLIKMEKYIRKLEEIKPDTYSNYKSNQITKYAIERLIQLVVDLALDINNHIIKEAGKYPANDYFNSFIELIELGILTENFAHEIAPSTGLRNRLVHEYEKVNEKIVYKSIDKTISYYKKYVKEIYNYLR